EELAEQDRDDLAGQAEKALDVIARAAVDDRRFWILEDDDIETAWIADADLVGELGDKNAVAAAIGSAAAGQQCRQQGAAPATPPLASRSLAPCLHRSASGPGCGGGASRTWLLKRPQLGQ